MKKNGMSLIEVVVSVALITILAVSVAGIIALSYNNISANGISINSINDAKANLDLTMSNTTIITPPAGVLLANDERTYANLDGVAVETRYITSQIPDPTGKGTASNEFIYAFQMKVPAPDVYLDRDKNGKFDPGIDEAVDLADLGHKIKALEKTFTVAASENLVFEGSVYLESAYNNATVPGPFNCLLKLVIDAPNSDVIFKENSKLVCNGGITIKAKNILMTNSQVSSPRQWTYAWNFNGNYSTDLYPAESSFDMYSTVSLNASNELIIDNCQISAINLRLKGVNKLAMINGSDFTTTCYDTGFSKIHLDSKKYIISGNVDNTTTFMVPEHTAFYITTINGDYNYNSPNDYVTINEGLSGSYTIQLGDKTRPEEIYKTKSFVQFIRFRDGLTHWDARLANPSVTFDLVNGIPPVYRAGNSSYFK